MFQFGAKEKKSAIKTIHSTNVNRSSFEQRFGHNSWPKCGGFCKPMETEKESLCFRDNSETPEENSNGNLFVGVCVCVCVYVCVCKITLQQNVMIYNKRIKVINKF